MDAILSTPVRDTFQKKGLELSREVEPEPVKARDRETSATSRELLSTVMESLRSRGNRNPTDAIPEDPIEVFIKQQEVCVVWFVMSTGL